MTSALVINVFSLFHLRSLTMKPVKDPRFAPLIAERRSGR